MAGFMNLICLWSREIIRTEMIYRCLLFCLLLVGSCAKKCKENKSVFFIIDSTNETTSRDFGFQVEIIRYLLNEFEKDRLTVSVHVYDGNDSCNMGTDSPMIQSGFHNIINTEQIESKLNFIEYQNSNSPFELNCLETLISSNATKQNHYSIIFAKYESAKQFIHPSQHEKYKKDGRYFLAFLYNSSNVRVDVFARRDSNINDMYLKVMQYICPTNPQGELNSAANNVSQIRSLQSSSSVSNILLTNKPLPTSFTVQRTATTPNTSSVSRTSTVLKSSPTNSEKLLVTPQTLIINANTSVKPTTQLLSTTYLRPPHMKSTIVGTKGVIVPEIVTLSTSRIFESNTNKFFLSTKTYTHDSSILATNVEINPSHTVELPSQQITSIHCTTTSCKASIGFSIHQNMSSETVTTSRQSVSSSIINSSIQVKTSSVTTRVITRATPSKVHLSPSILVSKMKLSISATYTASSLVSKIKPSNSSTPTASSLVSKIKPSNSSMPTASSLVSKIKPSNSITPTASSLVSKIKPSNSSTSTASSVASKIKSLNYLTPTASSLVSKIKSFNSSTPTASSLVNKIKLLNSSTPTASSFVSNIKPSNSSTPTASSLVSKTKPSNSSTPTASALVSKIKPSNSSIVATARLSTTPGSILSKSNTINNHTSSKFQSVIQTSPSLSDISTLSPFANVSSLMFTTSSMPSLSTFTAENNVSKSSIRSDVTTMTSTSFRTTITSLTASLNVATIDTYLTSNPFTTMLIQSHTAVILTIQDTMITSMQRTIDSSSSSHLASSSFAEGTSRGPTISVVSSSQLVTSTWNNYVSNYTNPASHFIKSSRTFSQSVRSSPIQTINVITQSDGLFKSSQSWLLTTSSLFANESSTIIPYQPWLKLQNDISSFLHQDISNQNLKDKKWSKTFIYNSSFLLQNIHQSGGHSKIEEDSLNFVEFVEDVLFKVGEHLTINDTFTEEQNNLAVKISKVNPSLFDGYSFSGDTNENALNRVELPKAMFQNYIQNEAVIVGMSYKTLPVMKKTKRHFDVTDKVLVISVKPPIKEELPHPLKYVIAVKKNTFSNYECVYWNASGLWDKDGCTVSNFTSTSVTCECTHMTSFAVLMQVSDFKISSKHRFILSIISYVGCGVSITACVLLILAYMMCGRLVKVDRNIIHINLALAIAIANAFFICADSVHEYQNVCLGVSIGMYYSYLAAFFWMLVEGIHVYLMIVKVFKSPRKIRVYMIVGWVLPAIICFVTAFKFHDKFTRDDFCWLSLESHLIWIFVGPVLGVIFINTIILIATLNASHKMSVDETEFSKLQRIARLTLLLMPIFGLTWVFGVLAINKQLLIFQYVFTGINSFQGLFIFVCYCLINNEVKREYQRVRRQSQYSSTKSNGYSDGFSTYIHPYPRKRIKSALSVEDNMPQVLLTRYDMHDDVMYANGQTPRETSENFSDTLTKRHKKQYSIELMRLTQTTSLDDGESVCSLIPNEEMILLRPSTFDGLSRVGSDRMSSTGGEESAPYKTFHNEESGLVLNAYRV